MFQEISVKIYGCLMSQVRLLRRAVFVVDRKNKIYYSAYMRSLGEEPDYVAILEATGKVLEIKD
jgi:thiol peroxidase